MKNILKLLLRSKGKIAFLNQLSETAHILDVGCGNNSPYLVKSVLPKSTYVGIDVGDYNQSKPNLADEYILTSPDDFANKIGTFNQRFDAVISSHNIEHCNERNKVFESMLYSIKPGGRLYISFPCADSVGFPRRRGTLNYYDDNTHKSLPPDFDYLQNVLVSQGFTIQFSVKKYKPHFMWLLGLILEPYSSYSNTTFSSTWAFYGFESIIWAKKNSG